jgi:hypothetical protein
MDRPFTVDPALTAIAIGYKNPASAYIADQVLPRTPVSAERFKWTEYPIAEAFNVPDARVGRTGRVQQLEFGGEEKDSSTEDYGLDSPIPYSDINAAREARERKVSAFDPEAHAAMMLTDTIINIREVRAAKLVFNAANYVGGRKIQLAGSSQFSHADSDPLAVITTGLDATLIMRPNTAVLGRSVWSKLRGHPKLVNAVKGNVTSSGLITVEQFRELLSGEGIQNVHIGDAWFNTAKPGQAPVLTRAWGKHMSLLHLNPIASPEGGGVTFGLTAQYGTRLAGRIEDKDVGLEGGVRIRSGEKVKELIVAKDVGYFIEDAVA